MSPLECALWIMTAGAAGGIVHTALAQEGFRLPSYEGRVLCPGFIGNVLVGAFAAVISWALYGSGAGLELAKQSANSREDLAHNSAVNGGFDL